MVLVELFVALLGFVVLVVWFVGTVVFCFGGGGGGVVVRLKITWPVPLIIRVSFEVCTDKSPCLMSWLTYQSKSDFGGPSGT